MQKIIPHLWFDKEAEEAVQFYTSIFNNSSVGTTVRYTEAGHEIHGMPAGAVMTVDFQIEGYKLIALNGGPHFTFTPAISFMVSCESREEVDTLWEKLSPGGIALMPLDTYPFSERYGWIQDKYGLSWQIIKADGPITSKIVPSLLFVGDVAGKAEEAINFYISVFGGQVGELARYADGHEPDKEGTLMYGDFTIFGQKFAAMDSAHADHKFSFNEAISLLVQCETQAEIDAFWDKLSAVPAAEQCGWLKDKYGVSWQIAPAGMEKIFNDPDQEKAKRGMEVVLSMKKFDIEAIKKAVEGK